jgi:hypothetical protein
MILDTVGNLVKEVVTRVLPVKVSDAEMKNLEIKAEATAKELMLSEKSGFRDFVLEYEGRAADMPKFIQILRASVRPVLTYFFAVTTLWLVWKSSEIPTMLYQMDLVMLGFWFGERAIRNYIRTKRGEDRGD